jgi:hypothetical protein
MKDATQKAVCNFLSTLRSDPEPTKDDCQHFAQAVRAVLNDSSVQSDGTITPPAAKKSKK